jgi:hypothetical protein
MHCPRWSLWHGGAAAITAAAVVVTFLPPAAVTAACGCDGDTPDRCPSGLLVGVSTTRYSSGTLAVQYDTGVDSYSYTFFLLLFYLISLHVLFYFILLCCIWGGRL